MNKVLAIVLLVAVAAQAKYIPEIQDAIVRYPEALKLWGFEVPAMSRNDGSDKIIGGTDATHGQFPYQCHLSIKVGFQSYFCGCSILSNTWILTAAHCPDGSDSITVTVGDTDRNVAEAGETTRTATRHILHEAWGSVRIVNDIALIEIPSITLGTYVAKVCPAPANSTDFAGVTATVSGWGKQNDTGSVATKLSYVNVPVITNAECATHYGTTIKESNICTSIASGQGTCNGDSGGPLVHTVSGKIEQIGIVSFGSSAGCIKAPSAYTRVSHYVPWIEGHTQIDFTMC